MEILRTVSIGANFTGSDKKSVHSTVTFWLISTKIGEALHRCFTPDLRILENCREMFVLECSFREFTAYQPFILQKLLFAADVLVGILRQLLEQVFLKTTPGSCFFLCTCC